MTDYIQQHQTPAEMETLLGERLRAHRIHRNLEQATLAERAGVSVRTLRSLESGTGSTLRTLVLVVRALGRQAWLDLIAPTPSINPLMLTRGAAPRQRARKPRVKTS